MNFILWVAKVLKVPAILLTAIKVIMIPLKLLVPLIILSNPGIIVMFQGPLKLVGYLGILMYSIVLVDAAWLPGE